MEYSEAMGDVMLGKGKLNYVMRICVREIKKHICIMYDSEQYYAESTINCSSVDKQREK